ncbi:MULTISPECIES: YggS family pyridoxal phosphate-dependent enzyme [Rhodococcus]|uniref:YggS family pyridoxal phosphate-dependent enzyme n=1 Tax=Rhodococcus TaxID=1827 RepID=UPI001290D2C7|nr:MULTISPECIES: YggS family pyridoxal phosphate-dependent enzyme [Rhodococcus]MDI9907887.1 YggS family pyridoxal phosphate-dependent enzyme [Rhodococcus sp. IEGM 1406]MQP30901.1 YggS family pyridoxal phosphate-dependent enzyme [Rhodococcus erythropolis]
MRPTDMRLTEISTALDSVRARLAAACLAAGREVSDVALLPVTKFFPASDARILYELGCREFGESREQEAVEKVADFDGAAQSGAIDDPVRWHMIGQLQRNKARSVAKWAYAIHSVDSARLADALDRAALGALSDGERKAPLRVLIQVSLDGDPARGGVPTGELTPLAERIESAEGLEFAGLMAVPPLGSDPDEQFEILRRAHLLILESHPRATELSAGMTGDLEAAVRHGSTCVRVGTALLGSRPVISR